MAQCTKNDLVYQDLIGKDDKIAAQTPVFKFRFLLAHFSTQTVRPSFKCWSRESVGDIESKRGDMLGGDLVG